MATGPAYVRGVRPNASRRSAQAGGLPAFGHDCEADATLCCQGALLHASQEVVSPYQTHTLVRQTHCLLGPRDSGILLGTELRLLANSVLDELRQRLTFAQYGLEASLRLGCDTDRRQRCRAAHSFSVLRLLYKLKRES